MLRTKVTKSLSPRELQQLQTIVRHFQTAAVRYVGYRSAGWWTHEHKPLQHPGNDPEKRRQAALRYGILPQDYKTFDQASLHGDYPELGDLTYEHKDPHEDWTDPVWRRYWGEPMTTVWHHHTPDRLTYTGHNPQFDSKVWIPRAILVYGIFTFFVWYLWRIPDAGDPLAIHPAMPKQYPYDMKRAYPFSDPTKFPIDNYTFPLMAELDAKAEHGHH